MNEHKFPYKWYLKDGYPAKGIKQNGLNVFGTFICGGGSTMGYKLAGFNHLGGIEIDKKIAEVYKVNHSPKHLFIEDIREFNKRDDLPKELFDLDILDGSPPCSTFSMAGKREKGWGKKKKFREGQTRQRLDDLVFEYIRTIEKLKPKVALLENVKGMIIGNAKAYSKKVFKAFQDVGYNVQLFLLNAASMGVPQKRERVFFIGLRKGFDLHTLKLTFNENPILYGSIRTETRSKTWTEHDEKIWKNKKRGDRDFGNVLLRIENRCSNWNSKFIYDDEVCQTITGTSGSKLVSFEEPKRLTRNELINIGTFPIDYNFINTDVKYLIGMSVPPVMIAQIAHQIYLQWLSKIK